MVALRSREPGEDRLVLTPGGELLALRPTTTVRIDRLGRSRPLIGDASVARVGELVRVVDGPAQVLEVVR